MSQQPELISHPLPQPLAASAPASPASGPGEALAPGSIAQAGTLKQQDKLLQSQRIPHWLERAELFLRVLLRMYIGIAVCYAPWSHLFWDQNPLFVEFPTLSIYAANGAVRGLVSGVGLLNLWIALQDAVRHWDK